MKKVLLFILFFVFAIQANIVERHGIQVMCEDSANKIGKYFITEPYTVTIGQMVDRGLYPVKIKLKNSSDVAVKWDSTLVGNNLVSNTNVQVNLSFIKPAVEIYLVLLIASTELFIGGILAFGFIGCCDWKKGDYYSARNWLRLTGGSFLSGSILIPYLYNKLKKEKNKIEPIIEEQLNQLLLLENTEITPGQEIEKFIILNKEDYKKGGFTLYLEQLDEDNKIIGFDCIFKDLNFEVDSNEKSEKEKY